MDWKTWYQEHLCPPQQAVRRIRSGDRVVVAHATGEPSLLLDAMVANAAQYEHVEIVHMVAMGKAEYCQPAYDRNFHHNSFFLGATSRAAAAEGRADFTPVYFSEIPALLRDHLHPNVALIQVSPPDEHGYCSLGVSVDYTKTAAEEADLVTASWRAAPPSLSCRPPRSARWSGPSGKTWPSWSGTGIPFSWASAPFPMLSCCS